MELKYVYIPWYGLFPLLAIVNAERILAIFTMGARSHFLYNAGILNSLYDAGHQITIVTPFSNDECLRNYTIIDSSLNSVLYVEEISINYLKHLSLHELVPQLAAIEETQCYDVLRSEEIQNILNSNEKRFDVMFVELFYMYECFLPLAEKIGIPVIGTVANRSWKFAEPAITSHVNPSIGNPYNPATLPFELGVSSTRMSFKERILNLWYCLCADLFYYFVIRTKVDTIYRQYYPEKYWYQKKVSLVLYNNNPAFLARPVVPNVIEVGGIHLNNAKPLSKEIRNFIEESKHGVILFTLGSLIKSSTLDSEVVKAFRDAFAEIPQRVIWKFEDKIDDAPENILVMRWVPQRDILAHAKVKAFISHCGISGTYEAIHEGKPMIMTPLFGDQKSNAAILNDLGVGVYLDIFSVKKNDILKALNLVVNDTRYRDSMQKLSRRFKDRLMTAAESVVYWTEYVIKHNGAAHLRTVAADMALYQYFLLDVIFFMILLTSLILYGMYFILRVLILFSFRNQKCKTEPTKKSR